MNHSLNVDIMVYSVDISGNILFLSDAKLLLDDDRDTITSGKYHHYYCLCRSLSIRTHHKSNFIIIALRSFSVRRLFSLGLCRKITNTQLLNVVYVCGNHNKLCTRWGNLLVCTLDLNLSLAHSGDFLLDLKSIAENLSFAVCWLCLRCRISFA